MVDIKPQKETTMNFQVKDINQVFQSVFLRTMKTKDINEWYKKEAKDINETLGQLAIDLLFQRDAWTPLVKQEFIVQRDAIDDAIELLDEMMDRLHDAGVLGRRS
jgi:hypothetical protein